jgi:cleavage and polyadenylation specificity factor subunit 1
MQCYTELTPPTAVTHSLSLPFLSPSANNLIVAKTNLLQIFSLKSVIITTNEIQSSSAANGTGSSNPELTKTRPDRLHTTKLVLIAQYELSGTITSLARVKILQSKSGGEALLVALRDAKLSLVEWDPERYSISTISIHYYEREDILSSPWEPDLSQCVNYLSVDPSSRCAVLKFGTRHLAILPFHQVGDDLVGDDLGMDDYDPDIDGEPPDRKQSISKATADGIAKEKTPYAASFVLSLLALDPTLSHPIHLTFLYEYREPTFGVLYSQVASSLALLHERRDNVSYAVYTLDLEQRASTTLLSITGLPYDLFGIVPLSRIFGGALLVGGNEIIHVDQSGKTTGVAVNEFAKQTTSFALGDQSDLNVRLESCVIKQLGSDNTDLLIVLNTGELAVLAFKIDGRSVSGISIRRVGIENGGDAVLAGATCVSMVGRGRMFIGSEDCDSLVLGWSRGSDRLKRQKSRTNMDLNGDEDELEMDEEDIEDDEDDLYAETKPDAKAKSQATSALDLNDEYNFRVHDSLSNLGPMAGVALRTSPSATASSKVSNQRTEILSTSGRGKAGGLTLFQQDIRPNKREPYDLADAHGIWSVRTQSAQEDAASREDYDKYVVVSSEEKSIAYTVKPDGLEELKGTEFESDAGATVDLGTISGGKKPIQVLQSELRIYDGGKSDPISYCAMCSMTTKQWAKGRWALGWLSSVLSKHTLCFVDLYMYDLVSRVWVRMLPVTSNPLGPPLFLIASIQNLPTIGPLFPPCSPCCTNLPRTFHTQCSSADLPKTLVLPRFCPWVTKRGTMSHLKLLARASQTPLSYLLRRTPTPYF